MTHKTARDIMSEDCTCIGENNGVLDAARRLAELGVGAMPMCGEDDRPGIHTRRRAGLG